MEKGVNERQEERTSFPEPFCRGIIDASVYYRVAFAKCRLAALGSLLSWYHGDIKERITYED